MRMPKKKLPDNLFTFVIPKIATYSDDEIELFGINLDRENGKLKKNTAYEKVTVMLNLDKLIDIYLMGYPISIPNQEDAEKIFRLLDDYVYEWNRFLKSRKNVNPVLYDERLRDMDRFLTEFFSLRRKELLEAVDKQETSDGFDLGITMMKPKVNEVVRERKKIQKGSVKGLGVFGKKAKKPEVKRTNLKGFFSNEEEDEEILEREEIIKPSRKFF